MNTKNVIKTESITWKRRRTDNTMAKQKRTYNELQKYIQKTKDRV